MTIKDIRDKERGNFKSVRFFKIQEDGEKSSFVEIAKAKDSETPYMYRIVKELESIYKQPTMLIFL